MTTQKLKLFLKVFDRMKIVSKSYQISIKSHQNSNQIDKQ